MITFSEHSIIIRIKNQASEALEQINGSITQMLAKIDDHREGIQMIGAIAGVAFAGLSFGMKRAVDESAKVENALIGLESIVVATGGSFDSTKKKVQEFTQDGLLGIDEASTALKNLLARGYNQDEAFAVMGRLKDAASYGRQAGLGLGEAVVTATEGLKNENSVLVDNAGVTKNVAKMWEEYAKSVGKSTKDLTAHEKIQAEIAGIMKETQFQVGNAEKISKTYSGTVYRLTGSISTMFASLGDTIKPVLNDFLQSVEPIVVKITEWIQLNPELAGKIAMVATALTGMIAGASGLALALGPMYSGLKLVGAVVGGLVSPIGLVVAAITVFGVAYKTNFLGFKDIVDSTIGWIIKKLQEFGGWLGNFWDEHGNSMVESVQVMWGGVQELFKVGFEFLTGFISSAWQGIKGVWETYKDEIIFIATVLWETVKGIFTVALDALMIAIKFGFDLIGGVLTVFSGLFTGDWGKMWEGLKKIGKAALDAIFGVVRSVFGAINEWVKNVFGVDLGAVFSEVWEGAKNIASGAIEALDGFVRPILQGLVEFVQSLIGGIQKAWDKAKSVASWVGQKGSAWNNYWKNVGGNVYNAIHGTRASGGPVDTGRQYLVGERGPELFIPATNGYIVPNNQLGGNTININMGGVVVQNEADENRLAQKIKDTLYREMRLARLGF